MHTSDLVDSQGLSDACLSPSDSMTAVPSMQALHLRQWCPLLGTLGRMSGARIAAPSSARPYCKLPSAHHHTRHAQWHAMLNAVASCSLLRFNIGRPKVSAATSLLPSWHIQPIIRQVQHEGKECTAVLQLMSYTSDIPCL